jgi:site-specific recombinase
LVVFSHQDRSIRHLVRWNLALLNRKIVERSSAVGEHYIAYTRKEYRHIWVAAAGGGLLTATTAAIKLAVHEFQLPAFPEGMLFGINYAASFLMLGAFGLILATKQPAMTAATLAQMFRDGGKDRLDEVVEFTTRISHSQLAAAISNVAIVSLGAWLINGFWELALARPFLAPEESAHVIETLSPLNSGTVFYAALTGVVLWLSSMIGGWFDNWSVYHRVPQAIAEHPLGQRLGSDRMRRWAERLRDKAGSWGTSISLGFMLGLVPALGIFFGLPLDVRHVTLSTGMLAMASASLGQRMFEHGFFRGLAGIATMFVLNLGVSFALSLYTATRAYRLDPGEMRELGRRLFRRLRDHPRDFFLAPKTDFVLRTHEGAPEIDERAGH